MLLATFILFAIYGIAFNRGGIWLSEAVGIEAGSHRIGRQAACLERDHPLTVVSRRICQPSSAAAVCARCAPHRRPLWRRRCEYGLECMGMAPAVQRVGRFSRLIPVLSQTHAAGHRAPITDEVFNNVLASLKRARQERLARTAEMEAASSAAVGERSSSTSLACPLLTFLK